jgi:hypothetical protein
MADTRFKKGNNILQRTENHDSINCTNSQVFKNKFKQLQKGFYSNLNYRRK